jgi:enediyne biosynthesis protein E4
MTRRRPLTRRRWLQSLTAGLTLGAGPRAFAAQALFEEVPPSKSGIRFVHDNAMSEEHYMPETIGPGCCFFDYDNDGWMDIYLVNSGPSDFFAPSKPLRNALYRNNRDGTFTDVTLEAGVPGGTFGMGCAAADYDNDGYADLLVTSYGRNVLYHNNGDGTFTDVTEQAGVAAPGWHTSAVWFDYDNDGLLDLFLCSFVELPRSKMASTVAATRAASATTASPASFPRRHPSSIAITATAPSRSPARGRRLSGRSARRSEWWRRT